MKIAVFNSRKEKLCENKEISWEEFCHKVSQTKRTSETMVEYDSFPKEKQDDTKKIDSSFISSIEVLEETFNV